MKNVAIAGAIVCLAAVAAPAAAQDEAARKTAVEVAARVPFEKAMKGAPYSAEMLIEGSQTLADGNRINRKTTGRVYRDSEGRTRREEDRKDGSAAISITDPVAGYSYSLDPAQKIAWRTAMGASEAIRSKLEAAQIEEKKIEEKRQVEERRAVEVKGTATADAKQRAAEVEEVRVRAAAGGGGLMVARSGGPGPVSAGPLEHKTLDGLAVEGRKTTTVIPAGQIGNEQPITIVSEEWRSPELNVLVMTRHSDPRMGDSNYRLQNIVRAEPDRSLFMVPPDYTVKDTGIRRLVEASRRE